ncbi:serine protease (plasmid) [Mesorhizobium sp. AR02]|uniref:serine protease n=1 Tax=Mesorhizobium sp. AR02 TaxID=2865837 RepID=UPI002160971C|nr:serine protease [Mesorhizobium sp. AR02]UVK49893.1 serine protease [Mesorhizobium sp. AR02]
MQHLTRRHALCALAALFGGQHAHAQTSVQGGPDSTPEPTSSFGGKQKVTLGRPTTFEAHPWHVELIIDGQVCGGTVIGKRWILTAAHCLEGATVDQVQAFVRGGHSLDVKQLIPHEKYNDKTLEHDVALVRVHSTRPAVAIRLATPRTHIRIGEDLTVTGKGATGYKGEPSDELLEGKVPYVDNKTCSRKYKRIRIFPGNMCAGTESGWTDACQGDSGGPLTKGHGKNAILVGIVSHGHKCGKTYGVYTRVSSYHEWIMNRIGD